MDGYRQTAVHLLIRYLGISIRGQLQYKASFIFQSVGHLLITGIEFLGIWALFDRFGALPHWSLQEVAFFYGTVNIQFAIADALGRGFDVFAGFVKTGEFDRMLLRPRSVVIQLLGYEFTMRRVGRLLQGLAIFLWAGVSLGISWNLVLVSVWLFAVAGAVALFVGLVIIQATIAFWTVESIEIMNTLTYGGVQTAQYPLSIYRKAFQRFFTFVVPLGAVTYFPLSMIIGKTGIASIWFQALAPALGFFFLISALFFWRLGVRHYASTGS